MTNIREIKKQLSEFQLYHAKDSIIKLSYAFCMKPEEFVKILEYGFKEYNKDNLITEKQSYLLCEMKSEFYLDDEE